MSLARFDLIFLLTLLFSVISLGKNDLIEFSSAPGTDVLLEVLIAGPQTSEISSLFGHMGLRMKYTDADGSSRDMALSFVANTQQDTGIQRDLKGLTGFYSFNVLIEPFRVYLKRTVMIENRTVSRYILNSDPIIAEKLFKKLNGFATEKLTLGRYTFFKKNCASKMYEFFSEIGYFINTKFNWLTPTPPINYPQGIFAPVMLALVQLPQVVSSEDQLAQLEKRYHFRLKSEEGDNDDLNRLQASLSKMSEIELNTMLVFDLSHFVGLRIALLKELGSRTGALAKDEFGLFGFREFSPALYSLCLDTACTDLQARELARSFGLKTLRALYNFMSSEQRRTQNLIYADRLKETKQYQHVSLLLKSIKNIFN